jgi:hypothetical protein
VIQDRTRLVEGALDREGIHVLTGIVICGLALSATAPVGPIPWFFRAAFALLAGRALAASTITADGTRSRPARATILYIVVVWLATFSPVVLLGNPDVIRTSAIAAAAVLLLRGLATGSTLVLSALLLVTAVATASASPHAGPFGELEHALGATWPRGWSDVAGTAGFFFLGSVWATVPTPGVLHQRAPVLTWLAPLGVLGRKPILALLVYSLVTLAQ